MAETNKVPNLGGKVGGWGGVNVGMHRVGALYVQECVQAML